MIMETAYSSQAKYMMNDLYWSMEYAIAIWPLQPIKAKKGRYLVLSPWNA